MRLTLTFKTPDALYDWINDHKRAWTPETPEERQQFHEFDDDLERWQDWKGECLEITMKETWLQWGECLTVAFDTDAQTAEVQRVT